MSFDESRIAEAILLAHDMYIYGELKVIKTLDHYLVDYSSFISLGLFT